MAKETNADYSDLVEGLIAQRALLVRALEGFDIAIQALTQLSGIAASAGLAAPVAGPRATPAKPAGIRPDTFFRMTVLDAAKKFLAMVNEPRSVTDITEALNAGGLPCKPDSVATIFSKAAKAKAIEKIGSGMWGLPGVVRRAEGRRDAVTDDENLKDVIHAEQQRGRRQPRDRAALRRQQRALDALLCLVGQATSEEDVAGVLTDAGYERDTPLFRQILERWRQFSAGL